MNVIEDYPKTFKTNICVTQYHIDNGEPECSTNCAISLAVLDNIDIKDIIVDSVVTMCDNIMLLSNDVCYRAKISAEVEEFILLFDHLRHVEPFEFDIIFRKV